MARFDVKYDDRGGPTLSFHYCRDWGESGGCHGTNPDHGLSFEEAKAEIVAWHERMAQEWRTQTYEQWQHENTVGEELGGLIDAMVD